MTMIRKLQRKIVFIITLLLTIAITIIMLLINILSQTQENQQIRQILESITASDGRSLRSLSGAPGNGATSMMFTFYLKTDWFGEVTEISHNAEANIDAALLTEKAQNVLDTGKNFGYYGNYAFMITDKVYGKMICLTDASNVLQHNHNLVLTTIIIGASSVLLFFLLAVALSFWLVRPVRETFDKQKLFISNASHELKTPIAVISANADVLEAEIGENKWLSYIKNDSVRMSELVNELLTLARLDDKTDISATKTEFNLSDAVLQTALPFESRMFEMGKKYEVNVQPDIIYNGDESAVKHIVSILIDNAVKYSDEKGEIRVSLFTRQNKKIIEVFNTGKGIPSDKLEKVFERFYREDEARNSKSGGYGLGLSIAREIAHKHGGTLTASGEYEKWVCFTATL